MSRMDAAGTSWSWGETAPPTAGKAALLGLPTDGAEEPRLADAGLARQQQELAMAGRDVLDASIHEVEELVAPDEERATNDARGGWHGHGSVATGRSRSTAELSKHPWVSVMSSNSRDPPSSTSVIRPMWAAIRRHAWSVQFTVTNRASRRGSSVIRRMTGGSVGSEAALHRPIGGVGCSGGSKWRSSWTCIQGSTG